MNDRRRLYILMQEGPPLRFFLKSPKLGWHTWVEATPTPDGRALQLDHYRMDPELVSAYVVTYPSGEVLDAWPKMIRPPKGTHYFTGPLYQDDSPGYTRKLRAPRKVTVQQSTSRLSPMLHGYHATSLTNRTEAPVRVAKFGSLEPGRFGWRERGGGYYSPRQFREWYRVPDPAGWVMPGETVTDPDNWTKGRVMWVYFFEDARGDCFAVTSLVDHR